MDASVNRIASSKDERALLIGVRLKTADRSEVEYSLQELKLLVETAGAVFVEDRIVNRDKLDASFIIGKGFVDTIQEIIDENEIKLIVFDLNNIRPAQIRNLEERLKCRVLGRTEIILDIFAMRARSAESKLQVEMAQLKYILPRLKGLGGVLSRLGGGIGTRGPGEKMLETDRRHIQRRIDVYSTKLKKVHNHRARTRTGRNRELTGAVVGYTNAGKSTLINRLAKDDLFVEDRLFATLDSYTRKVFLEYGKISLLTDTVGFIRNLPANLVESFRSTLDEIEYADFVLHVVDITASNIETNIATVDRELHSLKTLDKPSILYLNKSDEAPEALKNLMTIKFPEAVIGSAFKDVNMDLLRKKILEIYDEKYSS